MLGGTLLEATANDPRTFNPVLTQETSTSDVLRYLFDGLVEYNGETAEVEPALAESWTVSKDGRTWTFVLRQGLQWSDGAPVSADDVIFTFAVIYDKTIPNSLRDVLMVGGKPIEVTKMDARTVRLRTGEPFGPLLRSIGVSIIPSHSLLAAYRAGKFNQAWGVDTAPRELIGTGPYIMTVYTPAQRIVYERNRHYWKMDMTGHRLPYIDRIVLTIAPNQNALRLLFQGGQTDIYKIRPAEYAEFKKGEKVGHYTVYDGGPGFETQFLAFNENPQSGLPPYKLEWFKAQQFRQGVAYAVDRQTIADQVYGGHAVPQYGPESPASKFFFDTRVMKYAYNLEKAVATLAEAGFKKGSDDVLRDAAGRPVEFVIATNADDADRIAIANIIRHDLERLGMKITLAPEAFNTLVNKVVKSYQWEAVVLGYRSGIDPYVGQNIWKSSGSLHIWYPREPDPAARWEADVDRYFNLAAATSDQNLRQRYYAEYQETIAEQVPVIFTAIPNSYVAIRDKFGNITFTSFGGALWNLPVVYVKR